MAKRKQKQRQRKMGPQEKAMRDAITATANMLTCPVMVASDHAEDCADFADRMERDVRIARLALEIHAGSNELEIKLRAVLEDFIAVKQRHELDLRRLCKRFTELQDHDVEHAHVEMTDDLLRQLMRAMFPPGEHPDR